MTLLFQGLAWYALVFLWAVAGFTLARRVFDHPWASWAASRLLALGLPAFLAWYVGLAGFAQWVWVSLPLVAVLGFLGAAPLRQAKPVILELEAVGVAVFFLLTLLRAPNFAVMGTEKPMDLAILASLMRAQPLPPEDPWFAGFSLPYYYWGFLPWILPARLSGFFPDEVFNLLVPTIAAVTAQLAFAWARGAGLSRPLSALAAAATVFLGTADGWAQFLWNQAGLFSTNLWESSRGLAHTITEFPLFTFHLGDLHPHLLCQPWVLATLLLWESANTLKWPLKLLLASFLFGTAAATNPWTVPFLGLAIFALSVTTPTGPWRWAFGTLATGLAALVLFFPAWANLPAAASGLGWVHTPTSFWEVVRVLLPGLLPLLVVVFWLVSRAHRVLGGPVFCAGYVVLALLTARPLVALALAVGGVLAWQLWQQLVARPPLAVVLACLLGLIAMELVYVRDPYGPEWYRMNTVFKTLSFVFLVLPVPALRLLTQAQALGLYRIGVWLVAPWLLALPQLGTVLRGAWPPPPDFAGLRWMAAGEAEAVHWLHRSTQREVLVEAVGDAYSDAARMSACSGVPAVLGWENHEGLWRPPEFASAIAERREKVKALYTCPDAECVQTVARELGATTVVIGSVERRLYPYLNQQAILAAGQVAFAQGEVTLVRLVSSPAP
ncbi:MAG: DUF2298 domain-containing protein [Thermoanaerobaculum sp.]|nr:DUF2298 domain-containing protein [Thermoanaerobaculum sp.]